ncbi:MAG: asparagine synthase (glutamine-hydrolyzing) [Calditrichaeota bacterium]|nr:asparagine synthase (glutamine-hydrolyzing) [Calditrichota bacterium]
MCGITGIVEKKDQTQLVKSMCDAIRHRGPNGQSVYRHTNFTIGHVRLAVIDLKTGDQPIYNEDKTLSVTFNGEIYNFIELREELKKKGHRFSTQTDTEVILHLFEEEGTASFSRLNGYFVFALLDHQHNQLYLVRDQFGIKPLHYYQGIDFFSYGSEIKAILEDKRVERKLNYDALHQQLNLRYNQLDETLFKGIFRLNPGHFIKVSADRKTEINRYYQLNYHIDHTTSLDAHCEQIRFLLKDAVKRQMISDVPLGLYLSGGIDSGSLVALASSLSNQTIKTFTLGFNEDTDEFSEAKLVAERYQTDHHEFTVQVNPLDNMEQVIWHAEEPKINLLQGFEMSRFLKNHVTVALSGMGGDELFAGYDIYRFIHGFRYALNYTPAFLHKFLGKPAAKLLVWFNQNLGSMTLDEYQRGFEMLCSSPDIIRFYLILRNVWDHNPQMSARIYHKRQESIHHNMIRNSFDQLINSEVKDPVEQILFTEFQSKMVNDYLLTEDRMSMANSIEQRVPFLDKNLVEYAFTIPSYYKLQNGITKSILRTAMSEYLPKRNLEKKKWGFTFNPYEQFRKDLKVKAEALLSKETIERDEIFNYNYIRRILDHPANPRMRWHYNYLWLLIGFQIWKKQFNVTL